MQLKNYQNYLKSLNIIKQIKFPSLKIEKIQESNKSFIKYQQQLQ